MRIGILFVLKFKILLSLKLEEWGLLTSSNISQRSILFTSFET